MKNIRWILAFIAIGLIISSPCYAEWAITYGRSSDDIAECVQKTSDGGYIVAGWTSSFSVGNNKKILKVTRATNTMVTLRLWVGSAIFAFAVAFWFWFFRNLLRPRFNKAKLYTETNIGIIISWNIIWTALGLWIYPAPLTTIPLIGLIAGLIIGWYFSR